MPFSAPGSIRASPSLLGCMPSGPAAVGEPGTGGMPVAMDAYFGFGCAVVVTSETYSKEAWSLLPREVSQPVRARVVRAKRAAVRIGETVLMRLRG